MVKKKYEVSVIDSKCKFYKLNNSNGKRIATIEFRGWKYFKYEVTFACAVVENNLDKTKSFKTLKEAKNYINQVLDDVN